MAEQTVKQALNSMEVGKAPRPSGVTSDLIKAAGATGVKGLFRFVNPLNRKARFHNSVVSTLGKKKKGILILS